MQESCGCGAFEASVREPRQPTSAELRLLDVLARQAADMIERQQAEERLRESEERFRTLADNISQLAWMADGSGSIFWYNRRWLDYTGTTLEEMRGWGWTTVHHPDHVERVVRRIQHSWDTGELWEDTFPLRGKDGGYRWFLSKAVPIRDAEDRIVRWLGTSTDITEQKLAEEALRHSREQLQAIVDDSPLGIYLIDGDFRICHANPTTRDAFGDIPHLIGRDLDEVMHILWPERYANELLARFRHTLATGEPFHVREQTEQRLDRGVIVSYEWQIHRLPLPDGRYGVVCYFSDISAQLEARRALQDADRQKDEFLAMLAHELRNPLTPIGNASELLAHLFPADPRAQALIAMIKRQTAQLTRLVDDLLDVSRITQRRIELHLRAVDLASIVAQALETAEPHLRERHHELCIASSPSEPLYVNGDETRLVQCIVNLLSNAAKYTDPRGRIGVRTYADASSAVIEVSDNGAGIAPELLPRVFDLFVQSERTLDRAQGGLGIGLSIVKRLIQMHGGTVAAHSAGIGHGSTFEIRLPRIRVPPQPVPQPKQPGVSPRRVLIVDDNVDAANSLADLLELQGHEAKTVYSGKAAIECLGSFMADAALLDIGLPEMNGYELAQRLRAMPRLASLRLVALTGYGQPEDRQRARKAGFDDHLVKPVDVSALERALAGLPRGGDRGE